MARPLQIDYHVSRERAAGEFQRRSEDAKIKRWNTADPPNHYERWRKKAIGLLQGIRNRFIDDPTLLAEIR